MIEGGLLVNTIMLPKHGVIDAAAEPKCKLLTFSEPARDKPDVSATSGLLRRSQFVGLCLQPLETCLTDGGVIEAKNLCLRLPVMTTTDL